MEEKHLVSRNKAGDLYTYSERYLDIATKFMDQEGNAANLTKAWFDAYHFPTELSWANIKVALKTTYAECLSNGILPKLHFKQGNQISSLFKFMIPFIGDIPEVLRIERDANEAIKLPFSVAKSLIGLIAKL